ncbi:MAG: UMUC domain-containing protein DNA-repair protein [Porticoccaceae bacterium]|nr:MAG: UMUC domain-containing protein DNA-repair protein [Porticoccaceae bacterium]
MFALVDCNSYYASCEQIFRPDLRGKPVIVLSNNDGCIIARSREAKALGIPDLHAYFKVKHLIKRHRVAVFSSNFRLYGDISQRVMDTLCHFSPNIEIYSIDEMFLDLAGMKLSLHDYGQTMKQTLWQQVRMPVSVGIAPSKTLAKLANYAAKNIQKCQGVCLLDSPNKWQWLLQRVPVTKIWGVGSRIGKRLADQSIYTAADLARSNPKAIRRHFSVCLERTIEELNGTTCLKLEDTPSDKKQIYCSRSFGQKPSELAPLLQAVGLYACRVAEKLRAQKHLVLTIHVFIHTSPYQPNYYSNSTVIKLAYPTDDSRIIAAKARQAVRSLFRPGYNYLKSGVGLIELIPKKYQQQDIFQAPQKENSDALMKTLDNINQRYGQGSAFLAAEGIRKRWPMRQQHRSPCYTTDWNDLPIVKS